MSKKNKIKVLHIGWGFRPWRGGGLIEYAEDLMESQVKNGYEVYYFFAGRHYPLLSKSRLIKWERKGIHIYEVINSPIIHGGEKGSLKPDLNLGEPLSEEFLRKILNEIQPDIVHIQELAGLPSSLIDIIKEKKFPLIMTLHDYFLLCPTLKLFDSTENNCMDKNIGRKCIVCCQNAPNKNISIKQTIIYDLKKWNLYNLFKSLYKIIKIFNIKRKILLVSLGEDAKEVNQDLAKEFQERRDINIERLNKVDLLIAQSYKVEEIYKRILNREKGIITLHSAVKHIDFIQPKVINSIDFPINFAVLNGCASVAKGSKLILKSMELLTEKGLDNFFKLHIFGGLSPEVKDEILKYNNVFYHGSYNVNELNMILDEIEVGIIPSVWEEVYGYVGIEFLAKGIPVIGNKRGGIVDYTIEDFTGWVNKSCSAEELSNIIEGIIKNPEQILVLNKKIVQNKDKIIKKMDQHFFEIDKIYKELISKKNEK